MEFTRSRVTIAGMQRALERAAELHPELAPIAFVDDRCDREGKPFAGALACELQLASGAPLDDLASFDPERSVALFGFDNDRLASVYLDVVRRIGGRYLCSHDLQNARWWNLDGCARTVLEIDAAECERDGYTHFAADQLANLCQALHLTRDTPGDHHEIGVYNGTSARSAYHYLAASEQARRCYFSDTFEGFDYQAARESADCRWQGTHQASPQTVRRRLEAVREHVSPLPDGLTFEIVRANVIDQELPGGDAPIAVCNIDVDLYDAVAAALERSAPRMATGGIVIVQDPGRTPLLGGARLALDEFLVSPAAHDFLPVYLESGQTYLVRR